MYWGEANNSLIAFKDGTRLAREHSEKALALDANLAEPLSLLGYFEVLESTDSEGGTRRLEKARQLEPHNPQILTRLANTTLGSNRLEDALRNCRHALRSDPLSALVHVVHGDACYYVGPDSTRPSACDGAYWH